MNCNYFITDIYSLLLGTSYYSFHLVDSAFYWSICEAYLTMKKVHLYLILFLLLNACSNEKSTQFKFEKEISSVEDLLEHSKEFDTPEVIEVVDGIHVAIGYGLANSILIEGEDGNIIVDCTESNEVASKIKAEFNTISNKPIKAIIYTHNHADHIFGAGVMAGDDEPEIYSHALTNYYIDRLLNVVQPVIGRRSNRMFGNYLDPASHVNCGIGPFLDNKPTTTRSLLRPTITFQDKLEVEIEGVKIQLAHVPGETDDQLYVWLPKKRVLLCGDNLYKAFPNLYTIRGTPYRDVKKWASSLDKMRYLKPAYLIPSHTQPIAGEERIQKVLMDYADGVRFVHDQTIRYMNLGLMPDEIAEKVVLPPHLAESPYLKEFYGRVDWSVKNIFNGYMGWFDGNASTLLPLAPKEKAQKMAKLAGGLENLLQQAQSALEQNDYQWALELTDYLLRLSPEDQAAKEIRFNSLTQLAAQQSNPNARNYFLSQAVEAQGGSMELNVKRPVEMVHSIPLEAIFGTLAVRTIPEKSVAYNKKTVFHFSDLEEDWTVWVRNGVTEIQDFAMENPDLEVSTTSNVWKEVSAGMRNPLTAIASGKLQIEGGIGAFREFFGKFRE